MPTIAILSSRGVDPLVYDTFTDSDSTSLDAHTSNSGHSWTEQTGNTDIQSNRANIVSGSISTVDGVSVSDCTIQATINKNGSIGGGVAPRYEHSSSLWNVGVHPNVNQFEIWKKAGSWTLPAWTSVTVNESTDYVVKVVLSGTSIKGYMDDANELSITDSQGQTSTEHGIYGNNAGDRLDDFTIEE